MRTKSRSPLEPVATVITALLAVTVIATVASVVATVLGASSLMGFGIPVVQVDVAEIVGNADVPPALWSPHDGVSVNTTGYRFFAGDPDVGQRLWYTLTLLPSALLFGGALLLAYRLIRGAERDGIFTVATAARLRTLGWFLLIGGLAKMAVETVATNRLLTTMVANEVGWVRPGFWQVPWTVLVTAAGLLTFARVMRIGAGMRRDLEGTV